MTFSKQNKTRLGLFIYSAGIALGLLIAILLAWADFEASFFDSALGADTAMQKFSCPLAITSNEVSEIKLEINNPSEREVKTVLRLSQTEGSIIAIKRLEQPISFAPGETLYFSWPIQASDAAWGRFIIARVYMLGSSPLPSMADNCGILLINLPFLTGQQVIGISLLTALLLAIFGGRLWAANTSQPLLLAEKNIRLMQAYVAVTAVTVALAIFAGWGLTAPLIVVNVVLVMVILAYRVSHS